MIQTNWSLSFLKKEKLIFLCAIGILIYVFIGCRGSNTYQREIEREEYNDDRRNRTSVGCRGSDVDGNTNIRVSGDIRASNAGEYSVGGNCEVTDNEVEVNVEGQSIIVDCSGGRWSDTLNITSVIQGRESVAISVRSGSSEACEEVRNGFLCPEDYIPVSNLNGYSDVSFCVMKYEARSENARNSNDRYGSRNNNRNSLYDRDINNDRYREEQLARYNERAVSNSRDEPWTGLSFSEAKQRCRNNGSGYDLISNDEWQTIARHIESERQNWFLDTTAVQEENALNIGNTDAFDSRRSSGGRGRWSPDRTYHVLPNGEHIEDFSGSVWEMTRDHPSSVGVASDSNKEIYKLTGKNKELFGPAQNYSPHGRSTRNRSNWGLGYARLSSTQGDMIVRGGASSRDAGIFSVDTSLKTNSSFGRSNIGFRCVYHP